MDGSPRRGHDLEGGGLVALGGSKALSIVV